MDLSPQSVRNAAFKTVKKGYDPDEVDVFKDHVAGVIEAAQNQATAMEARARAAVAKLQEMSQQAAEDREPRRDGPQPLVASVDDAETISRTLLLAQRTADHAVADARVEADAIVHEGRTEASALLDSARSMAARLLDEARNDARRSSDDERLRAESEVQALLARRDFLLADVDHLEQFLADQRERLRDAAAALHELVDRVPNGLGEIRRPLLSASGDHVAALRSESQPAPARAATEVAAVEPEPARVDVFATGEQPITARNDPSDGALRRVRNTGFEGGADRRATVEPIDDLWTTADESPLSPAQEPTPMHTDSPLDFPLDVTSEVAVTAPPPNRETLRIIGDEIE